MTRTTRQVVEAMLPSGATIDDLSDRQVATLFEAVVQQADGAGGRRSSGIPEDAAAQEAGQD